MGGQYDIREEPRYKSVPTIRRMRQRSNLNINNPQQFTSVPEFDNQILPIDQYRYPTTEKDDSVSFYTEHSKVDTNESQTNINGFSHKRSAFNHTIRGPYVVRGPNIGKTCEPHESPQNLFRRLLWPTLVICVPMLALSAALLAIIFKYMVNPVPNIFATELDAWILSDHKHILVNFSATELVFLASFLSTAAPVIAGCIMSLVAVLVYKELAQASSAASFQTLPTPYQMSLLIGLLSASYEQLYNSFTHLWSRQRRARTSPVLLYAMTIFLFSILLGVGVALTDAYLHITTQTVSMILYSKPPTAYAQLGRGLNSYCLGVDRILDNSGFPCSYSLNTTIDMDPNFQSGQFEMQRLAHNSSTQAQIQLAHINDSDVSTVAYIAPLPADLPQQTNYRASTIGVSASCKLIPPSTCNLTNIGNQTIYTGFNCSSQFWGILGAQPVAATVMGVRPNSPNISFLAVNPASNLIYNYFTDSELESVYNTRDLNSTAQRTENSTSWPDDQLKNTIYAAYAWRSGISSFPGWNENGMYQSDLVQQVNGTTYVDYFVKCAVSAYDVQYVWTNGTLQSVQAVKYYNGSVLNTWAGTIPYLPGMGDGGSQLQDYTTQSIIGSNTTASYEQNYGNLISIGALSTIAAYSSNRMVIQQQEYSTALLARVPKLALGFLLTCSLTYPLVGLVLVICASRAIRKTGRADTLFSYWDLTWAAFVDSGVYDEDHPTNLNSKCLHDDEDDYRLYVRQDMNQRHKFGVLKRGTTGQVMEVAGSQTNLTSRI